MLDILFGSKNLSKILLFLFIHKSCYANQISRSLKTTLSPIQKALLRLQKGGIIESALQGKTRVYFFNQTYPLYQELIDLIQKAYIHLSPDEKKHYFLSFYETGFEYQQADLALLDAWQMLQRIRSVSFSSYSRSKIENGRNGNAVGEVIVTKKGINQIIFSEKGIWHGMTGSGEMVFSNVFRWTLDRTVGALSLEHLRHGEERPVFLFHLRPSNKHIFLSENAHLCGSDAYFGRAVFSTFGFQLTWKILGPLKNEEIEYRYKI